MAGRPTKKRGGTRKPAATNRGTATGAGERQDDADPKAASMAAFAAHKPEYLVAPKARGRTEPVSRFPEIVNEAARLFHEQGYAETSIEDIANGVGILKGSIYHYIHNKEDLLYAIIEEIHARTDMKSEIVAAFDGDVVDKLELFIDMHMKDAGELTAKVAVFSTEYRSLPPERRETVQKRRDAYEELLRSIIRDGQRSGAFVTNVDGRLAAVGILQMLNGTHQWFRPEGSHSMEEITREFKRLILRGLLVDPGRADI